LYGSSQSAISINRRVLLDVSPSQLLSELTIAPGAELVFGPAAGLELRVQRLLVRGRLTIGSEGCQRRVAATISLHGTRWSAGSHPQWGKKFLVIEPGGELEIHGAVDGPAWSRLAATVEPGGVELVLDDDLGATWQPGDEVVLAGTDWMHRGDQTEVRTIASRVSERRVRLSRPVSFRHFSGGSRRWEHFMRAEVGLLTRHVRIHGDAHDAAAINDGFGGHVLIRSGTRTHVEGVALTRMGQSGLHGRYPWQYATGASNLSRRTRDLAICASLLLICGSVLHAEFVPPPPLEQLASCGRGGRVLPTSGGAARQPPAMRHRTPNTQRADRVVGLLPHARPHVLLGGRS
jgi:hypothetical protein